MQYEGDQVSNCNHYRNGNTNYVVSIRQGRLTVIIGARYKPATTSAIITTGFGCISVLLIVVVWVSLATVQSVNDRMANMVEVTAQKSSTAYQMRDAVRDRSNQMRSLAQVQDPLKREAIYQRLISKTGTYKEGRAQLAVPGYRPEEAVILEKLKEVDARVRTSYNRVNNAIYNMQSSNTDLLPALKEAQLQELVLLNHLNDLVELEKNIAAEQLVLNQGQYAKTRQVLLIISIIAVVLGILITLVVNHRVARANSRIAHLASHDDLTGLINRREFEAALMRTIMQAEKSESCFGLMYVDLDRFKIVNDTCGHHAGDQLLIELSDLLSSAIGPNDVFARIGGDEFAIIAQSHSFESIAAMAEELRLKTHDYVFTYADQEFTVSLSIGVIPLRGDIKDLETVLTNVDSACYVAKQSGRNRVHVARNNDENLVQYRNDIAGIQLIRQALSEGRMVLFYQPVYGIQRGKPTMEHCEVLLRIKDEDGNLVSPAGFIPLAEKYNIMDEIDRWVISHVVEWVLAHQDDYEIPRLLVNLSGLSFIDREFLDFSVNLMQNSGINPYRIAFEITETAAVDNMNLARDFMNRLRKLGCRFALDDFGSGFSTFAYLKNLPIDYLKIDGSLVRDMTVDTVDREMVKAINEIGHVVGAKTIAEFVEDDVTLEILRELGVDYAQGFGLQRPRELDSLIADLKLIEEPPPLKKAA